MRLQEAPASPSLRRGFLLGSYPFDIRFGWRLALAVAITMQGIQRSPVQRGFFICKPGMCSIPRFFLFDLCLAEVCLLHGEAPDGGALGASPVPLGGTSDGREKTVTVD